jgi:hypothetical protein
VARVEDATGAGGARGGDRGAVLAEGVAAVGARVRRDDQDLGCAGEGVGEAGRVGEVAGADADAARGEVGGLARVARGRADLIRRLR